MACKDNICQLPIARPALSNVPIWGTIDTILRLGELVTLKESIISCTPVLVLLGGTRVRCGGNLESMT